MSEKISNVAVVDLGTNKTVCLIGREANDHRIEVIGHSVMPSAGIRRGVVLNIAEAARVIKAVVAQASVKADSSVQKLYLNVTGQNFATVQLNLQKSIEPGCTITQSDIRELKEKARFNVKLNEGDKVYHVITQSYEVDGESGVVNPIGIRGQLLSADYRLIIGPELYEQNIQAAVKMAGYEMVRCMVNPLAAAESVISDDEKEAGVAVVDLGAGTSSLAVYSDNAMCYSSIIPFGGNLITNDIKEGCSILARQAESLKVQFGQALGEAAESNKIITIPGINGWEPKEISVKTLAYIIQARMEEILESIAYQIQISGLAESLNAGIVLTGGGAKLARLAPLVRYKTGIQTRIGYPMVPLTIEQEKIMESPQFATAFGLLKRAAKDSAAANIQVVHDEQAESEEFIDEDLVRKPKEKKTFGKGFIKSLTAIFDEQTEA